MPILYCPTCELEYEPLDLDQCPACGGELEERRRPGQCEHHFVQTGERDEDGWVQRRCERCGEFE